MVATLGYFTTFYCAGRAFGAPLGLGDTLVVMPIVDVIAAMPATVSGLGVREQVLVVLLGTVAGVPRGLAVLISLTGFGFSAAWFLVGGIVFAVYRRGEAESEAAGAPAMAEA
jgi:hypothetical protein